MSTLTYFDSWYWSTNASSFTCPGIGGFKCEAPGACARDPNISKRYCCNANTDPYDVCWTGATTCSTDGSTFQCGSGQYTWCCISKREVCTPVSGQINICWSNGYNTLKNISVPALQSAHSSLSAAAPTAASSITFDPLSLIAQTAPLSTSTSTSTTQTSSTSRTSTTGPAAQTDAGGAGSPAGSGSSTGLSGGAIAGIAIGVAAGLALVALGIFFLWRRNKTKKDAAASSNDQYQYQQMQQQQQPQGYHPDGTPFGSPQSSEMPGSTIPPYYQEAYAKAGDHPGRPELGGSTPGIELPPSHNGWTASELQGDHVQQPR
ncbi:hypothetical protein MAPG_08859 [Magnaporthiopsis poae ATCC 64411]|uniref:Mid2 domain-containing protein n=1 Tax=Magnaporthiopsis poae (strain ATCC 64411 / 73-15) TaxID=644358 RepID=A0A0C4E8F8_MAGP6|nr:hypothetical protein MAPG_08859 [Magnaporthiopsis poae ATCC 64411]